MLTYGMKRALSDLADNGGEGAIDKFGRILAAGENLEFGAVTWLRLMTLGMIEGAGPLRIRLTTEGWKVQGKT